MLSTEDNELLTRTGPGTPMGELMRQYWIPALMSSELPAPDCPPLRVRLLGEDLVAFRSTSSKVGLLHHLCPHRGASLFYGRNEEEGLRCIYHGWKFEVGGKCVDMPNEPDDSSFKDKVCARAYPCRERNGVIFAYMGPRQNPPPLPDLEANMLPGEQSVVWTAMRNCNWLQALEGDLDTSHVGLLHMGKVSLDELKPGTFDYFMVRDRAPKYKVIDTDWGTMYGGYRAADEDTYYWRIGHFMFPFWTLIPSGRLGVQIILRGWVPLDDDHSMYWSLSIPQTRSDVHGTASTADGKRIAGAGEAGRPQFLPNTSDWLGRWRVAGEALPDYGLDRQAQATQSYTGIVGIHLQDKAVTESMGPIVDRSKEHLGSSDAMIIRTRRRLMRAAKELREGIVPPGVDNPEVFRQRGGGVVLARSADWVKATDELRRAVVSQPLVE